MRKMLDYGSRFGDRGNETKLPLTHAEVVSSDVFDGNNVSRVCEVKVVPNDLNVDSNLFRMQTILASGNLDALDDVLLSRSSLASAKTLNVVEKKFNVESSK